MPQFRKKPVVIEAVRFTGKNDKEIEAFVGELGYDPDDTRPSWMIDTLEGVMKAEVGDWIIKGVKGEFYPCKPDIFEATYEPVEPVTGLENVDSCTCGKGEYAPAIAHAESCPCIDWVSGQLEGDSPFEYVFPIDQIEDDRGKNVYGEVPEFRDLYNEEDDAHNDRAKR